MSILLTFPLVSVIIPNFNRKEELVRALRSVVNQTYTHLEIILVDDGSSFDNQAFLTQQGFSADGLRVIRNTENKGLAYTRNRGIAAAKGELIALLDSDDFWEKEKIEKQVQLMMDDPALDLVYCDTYLFINNRKLVRNTVFYDSDFWSHLVRGWKPTNPSTLMMKKSCFEKIGLFDEKLRFLEDADLWMRATDHIKVGYTTEILSNFSFDSADRISYAYKPKFERAGIFLTKWEKKIIAKNGLEAFRIFKNNLISDLAMETFTSALKFRKYHILISVYFKYLIGNKHFYRLLLNRIKR